MPPFRSLCPWRWEPKVYFHRRLHRDWFPVACAGLEAPLLKAFDRFLVQSFSEPFNHFDLRRNAIDPDDGREKYSALESRLARFLRVFRGRFLDNGWSRSVRRREGLSLQPRHCGYQQQERDSHKLITPFPSRSIQPRPPPFQAVTTSATSHSRSFKAAALLSIQCVRAPSKVLGPECSAPGISARSTPVHGCRAGRSNHYGTDALVSALYFKARDIRPCQFSDGFSACSITRT